MKKLWTKIYFYYIFIPPAVLYLFHTQISSKWVPYDPTNRRSKGRHVDYEMSLKEKWDVLHRSYLESYPYELRLMSKDEHEYEWEKLKRDVGRG